MHECSSASRMRWMCIDEDDVSNQESTRPSDTGPADYEATDFLDTMPMPRDEIESPTAPATSTSRAPLERAMARHESASVALSAAIVSNREVGSQRPRSSRPASPAPSRIDSTAKANAQQRGGSRPDAQPSHPRAARAAPPTVAASPRPDDIRRLREDWAVHRKKAHVSILAPSSHRPDGDARSSSWITASRSDRTSRRQGAPRAGFTPLARAAVLVTCLGAVAAAMFGAAAYTAHRDAQAAVAAQAAAVSPERPAAMTPTPQAPAAEASAAAFEGEGARPSTSAPDVRTASERPAIAVPSRTRNMRGGPGAPGLQMNPESPSPLRLADRASAPSNGVASAVEAAQAKADAFLRDNAQEPHEREPAKPGPADSPHDGGRS